MSNASGSAFGSSRVTVNFGATLIDALTDHGTFAPGNSIADIALSGFSQSSTGRLTLEIGGLLRGVGHDALNVTGAFTAGGTLRVFFVDGFDPVNGDRFDLLDWSSDSLSGTFAPLDLPSLGEGLFWNTDALYTQGILAIVGAGSPIPNLQPTPRSSAPAVLALAVWRKRTAG